MMLVGHSDYVEDYVDDKSINIIHKTKRMMGRNRSYTSGGANYLIYNWQSVPDRECLHCHPG